VVSSDTKHLAQRPHDHFAHASNTETNTRQTPKPPVEINHQPDTQWRQLPDPPQPVMYENGMVNTEAILNMPD